MSRPAASALRGALYRTARPALAPPRPLALTAPASSSARKQKRPPYKVPSQYYFEKCAEPFKLERRKATEYYRVVTAWQRAQAQKKTEDPDLLQKLKIPIDTFREAARFMTKVWTPDQLDMAETYPQIPFILSMYHYASDRGDDHSTIRYVRCELNNAGVEGNRSPNIPQVIRDRLRAINAKNRLPDSWVMEAGIAEHAGDDPRADSLAAHALRLIEEDPSLFFLYPDDALILRGHVRLRAGDPKGAESFFREAVRRFGSRNAALELLYDGECPTEVRYLTDAAIRGQRHDCIKVSRAEGEFAVKMLERGKKQRFLDHQYMAHEWMKLARVKNPDRDM